MDATDGKNERYSGELPQKKLHSYSKEYSSMSQYISLKKQQTNKAMNALWTSLNFDATGIDIDVINCATKMTNYRPTVSKSSLVNLFLTRNTRIAAYR